jgi:hypothetical protein
VFGKVGEADSKEIYKYFASGWLSGCYMDFNEHVLLARGTYACENHDSV